MLSTQPTSTTRSRSVLEMSHDEARKFFLRQESYCRVDLPDYFQFGVLLEKVSNLLLKTPLNSQLAKSPRECDNVNHRILDNKDGRYAWRPIQLIHPALYVSLAHAITETSAWKKVCSRFSDFANDGRIKCLSVPVQSLSKESNKAEQVSQWWKGVEQASIELSLDYEYIIHTDISDCYSSIYTHSVSWAIHTKVHAKKNRNVKTLIGNIIDCHLQDMCQGQTNGIPQGSVLIDFVAEIVLGYADELLSQKVLEAGIKEFTVIRYRDDYRIFVNNPQDGDRIAKILTEVMIDLGLKLNPGKTKITREIVRTSIKEDKLAWLGRRQADRNIQKHLLLIHDHSTLFPNAGSVTVGLGDYHKRLLGVRKISQPLPLISIVVDIAYRNPRCYPICAAILSILVAHINGTDEKRKIVEKVIKKFSLIPNTGHMEIWLQRISLPFARDLEYEEPLCGLVIGKDRTIWNCDWISSRDLKRLCKKSKIVKGTPTEEVTDIVATEEVSLFLSSSGGY